MSNATITNQIACINLAASKGFTIDDSIELFDNYDNACKYIIDNYGDLSDLPLIYGDYSDGYICGDLPMCHFYEEGNIHFNDKLKRWEQIAQDFDGNMYLIVAHEKTVYICYNIGSESWDVEKFDQSIDWHNSVEFKGSYIECLREKRAREIEEYRFNRFMPHLSNC